MQERCFDFRRDRCPSLLSRIISVLESCPPKSTVTILFDDKRMSVRLPRFLPLYGTRLVELHKQKGRYWRAIIYKGP